MKSTIYKFSMILILLITSFSSGIADVFDEIRDSFTTRDAHTVSRHFDSSIEFKIDDVTNTYSKTQAEMVLKEFYEKNRPSNFVLVHKGASNRGTRYAIGNYDSDKGKFRIYIYLKDIPGNFVIQELNIEKI